jgi:glucose/arabinose dehydrogenase
VLVSSVPSVALVNILPGERSNTVRDVLFSPDGSLLATIGDHDADPSDHDARSGRS